MRQLAKRHSRRQCKHRDGVTASEGILVNVYSKYMKRTLDILICIVGLPAFVLLYIVFGLLIKFYDGGPIFYKSDRIGKDSKLFKMYKFRSMKVNAPHWLNVDGSTYNAYDDPRVTKIGKFLRETSIDEIPQILNVFAGHMSIVGPRPSLSGDLGTFRKDEMDKMMVRPGITGLTQAYYRNGISIRERRLKDAWYANNVNFMLDVKVFIKTIFTVLKREGLYTNSGIKAEHQSRKGAIL